MKVGDRVVVRPVQCIGTITEIIEPVQVCVLLDCDQSSTPTWFFLSEIEPYDQ